MFVLNINDDANEEDVQKAYKRLVKFYHPDTPTGNDMKFKLLNKAKDVMLKSFEPNDEVIIEPEPEKKEYCKLRLVKNHPWGDWYNKSIN